MKTKDLTPAKSFGEVTINLKFRTGVVGETEAWQLVPELFDKFLTALKKSAELSIWEAVIEDVRYDPFKPTCGGKAFKLKLDDPIVKPGT